MITSKHISSCVPHPQCSRPSILHRWEHWEWESMILETYLLVITSVYPCEKYIIGCNLLLHRLVLVLLLRGAVNWVISGVGFWRCQWQRMIDCNIYFFLLIIILYVTSLDQGYKLNALLIATESARSAK